MRKSSTEETFKLSKVSGTHNCRAIFRADIYRSEKRQLTRNCTFVYFTVSGQGKKMRRGQPLKDNAQRRRSERMRDDAGK